MMGTVGATKGKRLVGPDAAMLHILDLHSQGYLLAEASDLAEVDPKYWTRHRQTFLAALGALNIVQAVRQALEHGLIRRKP